MAEGGDGLPPRPGSPRALATRPSADLEEQGEDFKGLPTESSTCSSSHCGEMKYRILTDKASRAEPHLLRGMPISRVLHCFARILGNNQGTARDFSLSEPVSQLDCFISHTWSTPRGKKFMTLLFYNNLWPALVVSICFAFIACILLSRGLVSPITAPGVRTRTPDGDFGMDVNGRTAQVVGFLSFVVTLLVWHEMCGLLGIKGDRVFLDKACVHQTDQDLKQKSIESLAAFLNNSRCMVVIYSDSYLKRLWTVYELASFLLLKPEGAWLQILPVDLPVMFIGIISKIIFEWTCNFAFGCWHYQLGMLHMGMNYRYAMCLLMVALPLAVVLQSWARTLRRIRLGLEHSDIKATQCACEADRATVESNIEAFMKHTKRVSPIASQAESLAAFAELVQRTVPRLMSASFGRLGVRYRIALLLGIRNLYAVFDAVSDSILSNWDLTEICMVVVASLMFCFVNGPLIVAAGANFARETAKYHGCAGVVVTALNVVVITWAQHMLQIPTAILFSPHSRRGTLHLIGLAIYSVFLSTITYAIYNRSLGADDDDSADRGKGVSKTCSTASEGSSRQPVVTV